MMQTTSSAITPPGRSIGRAFWSGADTAAAPAGALLITAGLVRTLGAHNYGIIVIALAASALSMAISPAVAATTTKLVSHAAGVRDDFMHPVGRIVTASLITLAVLSACLLAVMSMLRDPLSHVIFGDAFSGGRADSGKILLLAVITVCIQQFDCVLAAALKGLERFREQALIEIAARLSLAIIIVAAAWITRDVATVLLAQCLGCVGIFVARGAALRAVISSRRLFVRPHRSDFSAILSFGSWMWLGAIAGLAYFSADRIIVGRVLGATAAAEFNIYLQVAQLVQFVPSSLLAFSFPVLSRLSAEGRHRRGEITQSYHWYLAVIMGTALAVAVTVLVLRVNLLTLFAGGALTPGTESAFGLLVIGFLVLSGNVAAYYLLLALGRSRVVSLIQTVSMLVALGLTVVLVPGYGLLGAAIARLAYALGTLFLLERARHELRVL